MPNARTLSLSAIFVYQQSKKQQIINPPDCCIYIYLNTPGTIYIYIQYTHIRRAHNVAAVPRRCQLLYTPRLRVYVYVRTCVLYDVYMDPRIDSRESIRRARDDDDEKKRNGREHARALALSLLLMHSRVCAVRYYSFFTWRPSHSSSSRQVGKRVREEKRVTAPRTEARGDAAKSSFSSRCARVVGGYIQLSQRCRTTKLFVIFYSSSFVVLGYAEMRVILCVLLYMLYYYILLGECERLFESLGAFGSVSPARISEPSGCALFYSKTREAPPLVSPIVPTPRAREIVSDKRSD